MIYEDELQKIEEMSLEKKGKMLLQKGVHSIVELEIKLHSTIPQPKKVSTEQSKTRGLRPSQLRFFGLPIACFVFLQSGHNAFIFIKALTKIAQIKIQENVGKSIKCQVHNTFVYCARTLDFICMKQIMESQSF